MAQATINPEIAGLDQNSMTYELYQNFVGSMERANSATPPDFTSNPPMLKNPDGSQAYDPNDPVVPLVDEEAIQQAMKEYSVIQMKNRAFDMATSIMSVMAGSGGSGGSGGGSTTTGFLPLTGGTLSGYFYANKGFELGSGGKCLMSPKTDSENKTALLIHSNAEIDGRLVLNNKGAWFGDNQAIYVDDSGLHIKYGKVFIGDNVEIPSAFKAGDFVVSGTSFTYSGFNIYHSGNSNTLGVDWAANNLSANGNLSVSGTASFGKEISALNGFALGAKGVVALCHTIDDKNIAHATLLSDLVIGREGVGISYNGSQLIKSPDDKNPQTVFFSAPDYIMSVGKGAKYIALQGDLKSTDGLTTMLTPSGAACFKGLTAYSSDRGGRVIDTYHNSDSDQGVLFEHKLVFRNGVGAVNGPTIYSDAPQQLNISLVNPVGLQQSPQNWRIKIEDSKSLFASESGLDAALSLDTTCQFFGFKKPVEASFFTVASTKYATKLEAGRLLLSKTQKKDLSIEAVSGFIALRGDSVYDGNLSSEIFSSGLSGSGWAIAKDTMTGNYAATFDELTVRKKLRIYEMEVQRTSVSNGALWVSDSCSGDYVEELV